MYIPSPRSRYSRSDPDYRAAAAAVAMGLRRTKSRKSRFDIQRRVRTHVRTYTINVHRGGWRWVDGWSWGGSVVHIWSIQHKSATRVHVICLYDIHECVYVCEHIQGRLWKDFTPCHIYILLCTLYRYLCISQLEHRFPRNGCRSSTWQNKSYASPYRADFVVKLRQDLYIVFVGYIVFPVNTI